MARNPNSFVSYTFKDANSELSTMTFNAVEYNVATFADFLTALGDFRDSLALVSGAAIKKEDLTLFSTKYNPTTPTDPNFQRERKWLVSYYDETDFQIYRVEIPGARVFRSSAPTDSMVIPNTELADLTDPDVVLFVDDFEQVARSLNGGFVEVIEMRLVGRGI